ncbi:pyridoxamine 5'-phosphate oxidase family protein [bacterium]|nr:pyridoxamine 5'-phosphate oxidase family protein [bacterium]
MLYHYESDNPKRIYLHGAPGSRTLQHLANGNPVCIEVTTVYGLIYSRTAADHSMNYQSAVCFGEQKKSMTKPERRSSSRRWWLAISKDVKPGAITKPHSRGFQKYGRARNRNRELERKRAT